jgi:transposase InsO family protein
MDNGSELTSRHFLAWGIDRRIELVYIQPGTPVQNAHIESFHGRLRDECLNMTWFRKPMGSTAQSARLAPRVQPRTTSQQFGISNTGGVCGNASLRRKRS